MVYINDLQEKTLKLIDSLIEDGKNFNEVWWALQKKGYHFMGYRKNGYDIKTKFKLYDKNYKDSFVDLIKKRNGQASWETIHLF